MAKLQIKKWKNGRIDVNSLEIGGHFMNLPTVDLSYDASPLKHISLTPVTGTTYQYSATLEKGHFYIVSISDNGLGGTYWCVSGLFYFDPNLSSDTKYITLSGLENSTHANYQMWPHIIAEPSSYTDGWSTTIYFTAYSDTSTTIKNSTDHRIQELPFQMGISNVEKMLVVE